ncbi:MAG: Maf family nucleotide pyrophosphatase [Pseudomonadota bacterium]
MNATRLILASKSGSRRAMLDAAGVSYSAQAAELDERAIEAGLKGCSPSEIAEALSVAKAAALAGHHPDALVLGSDSLLVADGERFDKPQSREEAFEHLGTFSGKVIELHSAAALVRQDTCEWSSTALAELYVRNLSDDFIEAYLDDEWPAIGATVGCFRIEGPGVQLFERIEGDYFTVLGMPLLPVLSALREHDLLIA